MACPRCRCPEAVVLIDMQFEVSWQCVDCETKWPASDDEAELLLGARLKTIH
jgi:ssDNA-binding Zn-finger/Zn-ribbon topoisomerase 1